MAAIVDNLIVADVDGRFPNKQAALEGHEAEGDSGHWSQDYALPFDGLTDEELAHEQGSPNLFLVGSGGDSTKFVLLRLEVADVEGTRDEEGTWGNIPIAPPPPPIPASSLALLTGPPPPPPPKDLDIGQPAPSLPPPAEDFDLNDDSLCIICFDPNVIDEYEYWDDWDWYPQTQTRSSHKNLPCCNRLICPSCLKAVIQSNIDEGRVQVSCPHPECGRPFKKDYILDHCDQETKTKYNRFLVDIENDGKRKTCPNCCEITEHQLPRIGRVTEEQLKITCTTCQHQWCFQCHAPWHNGISCKEFKKGSKTFQKWTKSKTDRGVANCQKCPTCRVYIQRSSGCNHMTCNRCDTEFCYNCGGRYLDLGIIDHDSTLNVWGCSNNYHPDQPIIRKLVRGGYLTAKLTYLAGVPVLFVGACAVVAVGGAIVLPIYGGVKLYHFIKFKRSISRNKRK